MRPEMKRCLLGLVLLLSGCARSSCTEPPELHLGQDTCATCGMSVDDVRFAAALVAPDGTARLFDDIGEMTTAAHPDGRAWVHDFNTGLWIDAATATYVLSSNITTPMGGGILAVQEALQAGPLAARFHGRVANFESLKGEKK